MMMIGAGVGFGKAGSEINQRSQGYPSLTPPEMQEKVSSADERSIADYLDKMMHISEMNNVPQQHLNALKAISQNEKYSDLAHKAEKILSIMKDRAMRSKANVAAIKNSFK
jgi:hypothetical protein